MFVRNCWYVAAWEHELTTQALHAMSIANVALVLYRTERGEVVALEDRCCHRSAPLSKGRIEEGSNVRCMYHGFKFAPDGRCIEIPGEARIPGAARVKAFPALARHGWVWVWMGDPERADQKLIPEAVGVSHPDYIMKPAHMDYAANYELINDNLTDFSHLSYVHAKSFGASDVWASHRPFVDRLDRGIRVTRWLPTSAAQDADGPAALQDSSNADTALYETYDFLAPGILLMYSAYFPIDQMPEDGRSAPTMEPLSAQFTSQAVTPMTNLTSRYFFTWGPRRKDPGSEELADQLMALGAMAFAEDKDMIEAQQKVLNGSPARQMATSADLGPQLMRKVLRDLAAAEAVDA
jgi:phenylpropionate dioxygenase-like ring-hydroxylating dioxygenase large terminal subunit